MKRFIIFVLSLVFAAGSCVFADEIPNWAQQSVSEADELGIMPDFMYNDYSADATRAEFCLLCENTLRKMGIADGTESITFTDVSADDKQLADAVSYCAGLGIVSGVGSGLFQPDRTITRCEAAKMLCSALECVTDEIPSAVYYPHIFTDGGDIPSWSRQSIYAAYHTGIMVGDSETTFNPLGSYTRLQSVCTFLRLYKSVDGDLYVNKEYYPSAEYDKIFSHSDGRCYIDMAYQWNDGGEDYLPIYTDGAGGTYTADELGYAYPIGAQYTQVITSIGVGVGRSTVINKNKDDILSGKAVEGITDISGKYALVSEYGSFVYDLETGEKMTVDGTAAEISYCGCGMYKAVNTETATACFLNSDFVRVTDWKYTADQGMFLNNLYAAKTYDGYFDVINTNGEVIKTTYYDSDAYAAYDVFGTNILLSSLNSAQVDLLRAVSEIYVYDIGAADFLPNGEILCIKDYTGSVLNLDGSTKFTYAEKGYTDIYTDAAKIGFLLGSKTSRTSPYTATPYDLLDINGNVLLTDLSSEYIITDGGGIYCGKQNDTTLTVFDKSGSKIGTVATDESISSYCFVNGLLKVGTNLDENFKYYLPTGEMFD